jgi:hypothetical protein
MKLSALKLLLASLAVSSFAIAGCAADTTDPSADGEESEDVGVSADELSSRAQQFVGAYSWRAGDSGPFVELQQLTLKNNGNYTAKVDSALVNKGVQCIAFPCTLPESGSWTVVRSGGQDKIKLNPAAGGKPNRSYYASVNALSRILELKRYGQTTTLFPDGSTCANVRCTSATHCEMKFANGGYAPKCVLNDYPPPPPVTCAAVLCAAGTTCVDKPTGAECVAPPPAACVKGGCSGQICADHSVISTCEFRPEYACYQTATCARQADGQCGWTKTAALTSCLANP